MAALSSKVEEVCTFRYLHAGKLVRNPRMAADQRRHVMLIRARPHSVSALHVLSVFQSSAIYE